MEELKKIIAKLKELPEDRLASLLSDELPSITLIELIQEYSEYVRTTLLFKYLESHSSSNKYLLKHYKSESLIKDIDSESVQKFMNELRTSVPKGWAVYYRNYRALFNYAIQMEYLRYNPFAKLNLPKKQKDLPTYLTYEEVKLIQSKIFNHALKLMVEVAFFTGMRRSELCNLKWNSCDFKNKSIQVGDSEFSTKTRRIRVIPMCKEVEAILNLLKPSEISKKQYVFCKNTGSKFHQDYVTHVFKRAAIESGIDKDLHFHSLRHSTASTLVQNGASLYAVKEILGHSSISTTEIYAHMNLESLRNEINKINSTNYKENSL